MSPLIQEHFGTNTFYDILALPCDKDINHPHQIKSKVDFRNLKDNSKKAILSLPIVQYTGDFKAGGLD